MHGGLWRNGFNGNLKVKALEEKSLFESWGTGVYRRPKPSAEAEGFNPLASASVAEVLWPKVWLKVNVWYFHIFI